MKEIFFYFLNQIIHWTIYINQKMSENKEEKISMNMLMYETKKEIKRVNKNDNKR
jgi:hypothetical protein